jgi:hypothetical protein
MQRTLRFLAFAFAWLPAACVGAPDTSERLTVDHPLEETSEKGIVDARLELMSAARTGDNDFLLTLDASDPADEPSLDRVVASMPSHGHSVVPRSIEDVEGTFRIVALPLSMPGFWQIECRFTVGETNDFVVFDVEVP